MNIALAYINGSREEAQTACLHSIIHFGCTPVITNGTPRPLLGDMLKEARALSGGSHFGWVNSDCEFLISPHVLRNPNCVVGIQRIESDSTMCDGVDAYIFPCDLWDKLYSKDIPKMYVGGTHVDWWLTRLAEKHGVYTQTRLLLHPSHPRSETSAGLSPEGQHNLREFNAWADRNGVKKD